MAKFQVAFCLLVAFTVMLQVEAGYLYPQRKLYDELFQMDDLRDMNYDNGFEPNEGPCLDKPGYTSLCRFFSKSHCNDEQNFVSYRNYLDFRSWCKRTCKVCR